MTGRILVATRWCITNPSAFIPAGQFLQCKQVVPVSLLSIPTQPPLYLQRQYVASPLCCPSISREVNGCPLSVICRHGSSTPGEEPGWLKQKWVKFMTTIRAFATGTKALYKDVVKMREIQSKHRGRKMVFGRSPRDPNTGQLDFPLTREELSFTVKTRKDLWKMLPTVILFFIPFLGYFVPLVAFMYPHRFLSPHFLTEQQRAELVAYGHQKSLDKTRVLSDALQQGADDERLNFLHEASEMFSSGQVSSDINWLAEMTGGSHSLMNPNKNNMDALLDMWEVRSWLPFGRAKRQKRKLDELMRYIYTNDWLMKLEGGVETLSPKALIEVCCERRLAVDLKSTEDMRKRLDVWMKITTSSEAAECPEIALAHLPAAQYLQKIDKH